MDTEFKVGDRVIVKNDYHEQFARGQMATIRYDDGTGSLQFLIEFDDAFGWCHDGDGQCRDNHGWWIGGEWLQPIERIKLGIYKKENKEMELLEIYFENKQIENDAECEQACEKARKKDLMYKGICEIQENYKDIGGVRISIDHGVYEFNESVKKEILKILDKRDRRDKVLRELECEIKAQLKMCETYEQKQAILKAYNIIDEQGKLIK